MELVADMEARLAVHERASAEGLSCTGVSLPEKLYSSRLLHRLVPDRLALAAAALAGRIEWRVSARSRVAALSHMETLLAGTARSSEVEALAPRHVIETRVRGVVFWRPSRTYRRTLVEGIEHLLAASERGNGVLLMTAHLGANNLGQTYPLGLAGYRLRVLGGGEWLFPPAFHGYDGHRALTLRKRIEEAGCRWIATGDSYGLCEALLRRGETCVIPLDVPGSHPTTFLGKPAWMRSGIARLALATGAPVIPFFAARHGHRLGVRLETPIDPRDFEELDELQGRLAEIMGAEILRRAEEREATPYLDSLWTAPQPH